MERLEPLQLVVLALIQGLTEWLPISSSAHLILFPQVTGLPDQGPLIDAMAHLGSLGAVLAYFWRDMLRLGRGKLDLMVGRTTEGGRIRLTPESKLLMLIALAAIPGLAVGLALELTGALDALRDPTVIALATIGFGALLWAADALCPKAKTERHMTWRDGALLGVAQALAFIPGTSRSGAAMTAARALGYRRDEAARIGMLIGVPLIAAVGLYALLQLAMGESPNPQAADGTLYQVTLTDGLIVAVLSFASALASVAALMALLKRISFLPFVLYRFALGGALLAFAT